jgi:ribosomal-protein-alanine N-acetyltransferase
MAVISNIVSSTQPEQLRPFDPFRDSEAVADLIEASFSNTLDPDGRRYLRQMRTSARRKSLKRWASLIPGGVSQPLSGFVWEQDDKVVGNLTLVSFLHQGQRINLIANVAVYPEYRRQGIAKALTIAALEKSVRGRIKATWLQVRHDNEAAINLYKKMGFISQARRTTWIANPGSLKGTVPADIKVLSRLRRHWIQQKSWLSQNYPSRLRWYFVLNKIAMQPGVIGALHRFISETDIKHWAVERNNKLLGVLTWQRSYRYADYLWLAALNAHEDLALEAALPYIRHERVVRRPISLDYPENRAVNSLQSSGFEPKATLIWMEVKHDRNSSD